ncbi:TetR/AcrR family transcriptional regulator [Paracoccus aerodenitrificans]|uniref:TetR/AcrR family transcriptional regulator n=1 Tax=Paracoccus aerodenitrificans TaxID=3017781 RepID=UPI0022F12388|nr:TetR/AcrR family transcriptional regulator [Paracoccus aerodenitrificans]WBU63550.1 TetR family transcriptional regulator [Paracoccus aerodenitrificans]
MTKPVLIDPATASEDAPANPRDLIMDAAGRVFGSVGFDGATTRGIAEAAGVNLGLIHYYFGNKRALFEATVIKQADDLNEQRRELLARLPFEPTLKQVFEALLRPAVEIRLRPDGQYFARLVADVASAADERSRSLTSAAFDPIAREFVAQILKIYPDAAHAMAVRAYMFAISVSISLMVNTGREAALAGQDNDGDPESVIQDAISFVTAGAERILGRREATARH